ncbi:MAG TPA: NAD(P)-dependent oxidoreductase [Acidimicrobiales bacterium]
MPLDPPLYPVNLVVAGRRCLVVGGGRVALQKVRELVVCGALVDVVAPRIDPDVAALAGVTSHERRYEPGEAGGYRLVIAATDDPDVNRTVRHDADGAGVWVNSADDPENCTFTLPARVRQGPLLVTFSTSGRSPALSKWMRRRFASEIGPEYLTLLEMLEQERVRLQEAGSPTEGLDWQRALDSGMLDLVREGHLAEAKERLQACLSSSSD